MFFLLYLIIYIYILIEQWNMKKLFFFVFFILVFFGTKHNPNYLRCPSKKKLLIRTTRKFPEISLKFCVSVERHGGEISIKPLSPFFPIFRDFYPYIRISDFWAKFSVVNVVTTVKLKICIFGGAGSPWAWMSLEIIKVLGIWANFLSYLNIFLKIKN